MRGTADEKDLCVPVIETGPGGSRRRRRITFFVSGGKCGGISAHRGNGMCGGKGPAYTAAAAEKFGQDPGGGGGITDGKDRLPGIDKIP